MAYYDFKKSGGGGSLPAGAQLDPWDTANGKYYNIQDKNSYFEINNGNLYTGLEIIVLPDSGYEGISLKVPDFVELEQGVTYKIKFTLNIKYTSFRNSYALGLKHLTSQFSSVNSSTFNITPDVDFLRQTGTQSVELQFTAGSENYFAFLFADVNRNDTNIVPMFRFSLIEFEEVTI